jgi:hypothetical protein
MTDKTEPFSFYSGATWMDLSGNMYIVPGFHEEWLHNNPEVAGNARTVADMVLSTRWVSVVIYGKGYVEICINDVKDEEVTGLVFTFLDKNKEHWQNALIMPLREEGFISVEKNELSGVEAFRKLLLDWKEK